MFEEFLTSSASAVVKLALIAALIMALMRMCTDEDKHSEQPHVNAPQLRRRFDGQMEVVAPETLVPMKPAVQAHLNLRNVPGWKAPQLLDADGEAAAQGEKQYVWYLATGSQDAEMLSFSPERFGSTGTVIIEAADRSGSRSKHVIQSGKNFLGFNTAKFYEIESRNTIKEISKETFVNRANGFITARFLQYNQEPLNAGVYFPYPE